MKKLFKLFFVSLLSFLFTLSTFAIDTPTNVTVKLVNGNDVKVNWSSIEGGYYQVGYGKQSRNELEYKNTTDLLDGTGTTITGLDKNTKYYFSVKALDDSGDESAFSEEKSILTNSGVDIDTTFRLDSVKVLDAAEIELKFTNLLDTTEGTEREFSIYKKGDKLDSLGVINTKIDKDDNSKLILSLDNNLEKGVDYEIIVIAIKNKSLENIKSGIDSVETFSYNGESNKEVNDGKTVDISNVVDMNSAGTKNEGPSGSDIKMDKKIDKNTTLSISEKPNKLPKTGSEGILIFILSIILATLIFIFKFKKA